MLPITYGGAATLLVIWLGPEGLICMGTPLIFIPLIGCISKLYGKDLEKTTEQKDKRVRIVSDMIDLLKQVKMYAW